MQGNIVHFEINAKDAARAKKFYSGVFGWKFKDSEIPGIDYYLTDGLQPAGAINPMTQEPGPVVYFSVDWWRTQHPGPVIAADALPPEMLSTFLFTMACTLVLAGVLIAIRYRLETLMDQQPVGSVVPCPASPSVPSHLRGEANS